MRSLLTLLLSLTFSPMLMAQGIAVRSLNGFGTNTTLRTPTLIQPTVNSNLSLIANTSDGSDAELRLHNTNSSDYFFLRNGQGELVGGSSGGGLTFKWADGDFFSDGFYAKGAHGFNGNARGLTNYNVTNLVGITGTPSGTKFIRDDWSLQDIPAALGYTPPTNNYAGITDALGFQPATNGVTARYSTNAHASATNSLDMSRNYADFSATTAMAITNFSNVDATRENSSVLMVTNGSGGEPDDEPYLRRHTMDGARIRSP